MAKQEDNTVSAKGVLGVWKPAPADHPIHNLVGRVASNWAHIEHLLDIIIWEMLGAADPIGACITAQIMGAANRLEAIRALCKLKGIEGESISQINKIAGQIHIPQTRRNRIVHDPWYIGATTDDTAQFKAMPRDVHQYGIKPVGEAYIIETLEMIEKRRSEIAALRRLIQRGLAGRR